MTSQVQRSAAAGVRTFGAIQPRVCLNSRKVCSRSNRRRNACHSRSRCAGWTPVAEDHSHTGFGSRSPGRYSTLRRINVPSMREFAVVVEPGAAVLGEPGMQTVPGAGFGFAVAGGVRRGGGVWGGPGV